MKLGLLTKRSRVDVAVWRALPTLAVVALVVAGRTRATLTLGDIRKINEATQ